MLIDGRPASHLDLADRGLAYGDGLFETLRYSDGRLLFADLHLARLARGGERLGIPIDTGALRADIETILAAAPPAGAVLKIIVTRGAGGRGYRPPAHAASTRILTLHPLPEYPAAFADTGIRVFVCRQRLALQPALAGMKHLNRLEQVLASREWPDDGFQEGLMLDTAGHVVEGTRSNLFLVRNGRLFTPSLAACGVDGVMREVLLRHFGDQVTVTDCPRAWLDDADEIFVCNSIFGIWPVREIQATDSARQLRPGTCSEQARHCFDRALQA